MSQTQETSGAKVGPGVIAGAVGLAVLLTFMVQNRDDVTTTFLLWSFTWPVWLLTLVAALVGALVLFGVGVVRRRASRRARR